MMRRTVSIALCACLAACSGNRSLEFPVLTDPSPFHAARELRIDTTNGVDVVEVGAQLTLHWVPGGFVQYLWTLAVPAGSLAVLSDPAAASPVFTPDVEGEYTIGVATRIGATPVASATKRVVAATYLGVGACAECHETRVDRWRGTGHAQTIARQGKQLFDTPGCLACHVVGSDPTLPVPVPGGFDAEAAILGFKPSDFVDATDFEARFPSLAERGSVQCESCHGPGSLHRSDPRRTNVSTAAQVCGTCHNTFGPRYKQWQLSVHAAPPPRAAAENPSCVRCHTARGFARTVAGLVPRDEGPDAPGVTCAACHDPHGGEHLSEVRQFGTAYLADGFAVAAGRAAVCVSCHQTEVADAAGHADRGDAFPCAVQADMVAGRGAVEFGLAYKSSFHGDPGFKTRNLTGDPNDPLIAESCVACHMAPTAAAGPFQDRAGGHTWRLRDGSGAEYAASCARCHPGLATFDRNLGRDYDGNGAAEGVQTEIRGLLELVAAAALAADPGAALSRPGGPGGVLVVAADRSRSTPLLRQAAYNYNFVLRDGSLGVHNSLYAVQVLQNTRGQLTGLPFRQEFPLAFVP